MGLPDEPVFLRSNAVLEPLVDSSATAPTC
jgi:hypothetical protein